MIIGCTNSYISLLNDFYLVNFKTLGDLQNHIKKELPIKAKKVNIKDRTFVYTSEDISDVRLIYLNKYKQIYKVKGYHLSYDNYNKLKHQCNKCKYHEYIGLGNYKCKNTYEPNRDYLCIYFEEKKIVNLITKVKNIFKIK